MLIISQLVSIVEEASYSC